MYILRLIVIYMKRLVIMYIFKLILILNLIDLKLL